MTTISERLQAVKLGISEAAREAGRDAADITLIAVSKTHPEAALREAYQAGQRDFGESYLQEAENKIAALSDLDITWHFIGPIQSNKTKPIAELFAWVHGVDRLKIAQRLSDARPDALPLLNVCIQVNVSGEASKSGCNPAETLELAKAVSALPRLKLRGLMAIPEPTDDVALQRQQFQRLRQLLEELKQHGLALDTLSMGMSHDYSAAIQEGATMVRVGTAIFGARPAKV